MMGITENFSSVLLICKIWGKDIEIDLRLSCWVIFVHLFTIRDSSLETDQLSFYQAYTSFLQHM